MRTSVVDTTQAHLDFLKPRLREADEIEVRAMAGISAAEGLQYSADRSEYKWTGCIDGEPVLCFGAAPFTMIGDGASPWMLASDRIKEVKTHVLRASRNFTNFLISEYVYLENYIHAENVVSMAWLRWCGFKHSDGKPMGRNGELFYKFWKGY